MQNKKQTPKTETKVSNVQTSKLQKINLEKFSKELEKVDIKERLKKQTLYNYPETFTEKEINSEIGKKFRNKLRNTMQRLMNNILVYAKSKQDENLLKEVSEFMKFYKFNYRLNDFSFSSISNSKKEEKEKDLKLMLEIVKEFQK